MRVGPPAARPVWSSDLPRSRQEPEVPPETPVGPTSWFSPTRLAQALASTWIGRTALPASAALLGSMGGVARADGAPVLESSGEVVRDLPESVVLLDLEPDSLTRLRTAYPARNDGTGSEDFAVFRPQTIVDASGRATVDWRKAEGARVSFTNGVSAYVFRSGDRYFVESSGVPLREGSSQRDQTVAFSSFDGAMRELGRLEVLSPKAVAPVGRRAFASHDDVAVVISERTYTNLKSDVDAYVEHLHGEGRGGSRVVVLPEAVVSVGDPTVIRQHLKSLSLDVDGLFLIGDDLVPFEVASSSSSSKGRGTTDLPFGDLDSTFWDQGVDKADARFGGMFRTGANAVFRTDAPTRVAFDMNELAKLHCDGKTQPTQKMWVSRWMVPGPPEAQRQAFGRFVAARMKYRPPETHRAALVAGSERMIYKPVADFGRPAGDSFVHDVPGSTMEVVRKADLEARLHHLDPSLTFAAFSEHGTPETIGNIGPSSFRGVERLPEVMLFEGCLNGDWTTGDRSRGLVANSLSRPATPPMAIVAHQSVSSYEYFGGDDRLLAKKDYFLADWKAGQGLGDRQVESVNANMAHVPKDRAALARGDLGAKLLQVFSASSIFGDGTVEK